MNEELAKHYNLQISHGLHEIYRLHKENKDLRKDLEVYKKALEIYGNKYTNVPIK